MVLGTPVYHVYWALSQLLTPSTRCVVCQASLCSDLKHLCALQVTEEAEDDMDALLSV